MPNGDRSRSAMLGLVPPASSRLSGWRISGALPASSPSPMTAEMAAADRSGRPRRPDRRAIRAELGGAGHRARGKSRPDRRRALVAGAGHRPSLPRPGAAEADLAVPGLLPLLLSPRGRRQESRRCSDPQALERAFDYIRERPQIWEVIVTGGDPFLLAPRRIAEIVRALDQHPASGRHPVPHPRPGGRSADRVSAALVAALAAEKAVYIVVHANHPRELTTQAREAALAAEPRRHSAAFADGLAARRQ